MSISINSCIRSPVHFCLWHSFNFLCLGLLYSDLARSLEGLPLAPLYNKFASSEHLMPYCIGNVPISSSSLKDIFVAHKTLISQLLFFSQSSEHVIPLSSGFHERNTLQILQRVLYMQQVAFRFPQSKFVLCPQFLIIMIHDVFMFIL